MPDRAPRVALVMVVVTDLAGSGGAERQFSQLHEFVAASPEGSDLTLITAATSLERLRAAGRLTRPVGVLALRLGSRPGRGKIGVAWLTFRLLWATLIRRFDLVHVCLPAPTYVPFLAVLSRMPRVLRPRLVLNVVDCTLSDSLEHAPPVGTYERQVLDAHLMYFRWAKLDGIFSWYRAFVEAAAKGVRIAGHPVVRAARFCFTDTTRFNPASIKENLIIFAGRLSEQKRPLMFVDAVARLRMREPQLTAGWRVEMYGRGVLQQEVSDRIARHGLDDIFTLTHTVDMAPVLARSRLFVSTQAFENFTSLSMLEAMSAGNAVIAEDVGQTSEFVRDRENGLLVRPASADGFATAMAEYLRHPERHDAMAEASRRIATSVHTIEHFADDITTFWHDVVRQRT